MMTMSEKDGREIESVAFPSATVQAESTADGDAAVFILHIQPQLTSAPSLYTGEHLCTRVGVPLSTNRQLPTKTMPRLAGLP